MLCMGETTRSFVQLMNSLPMYSIPSMLKSSNLKVVLIVCFQVVFQHMVRHSPLRIEHLFASVSSSYDQDEVHDVEMVV